MDLQTILLWAARLACPIAMGVMMWWFLRQSQETPSAGPAPTPHLSALQKRQAALDAEITVLETQTGQSAPIEITEMTEMETPTA
jgi:hypothetical protein